MGCVIFTTVEDDQLIYLYKFSCDDYLFIYYSDENIVVGLIHPTPDIPDTPDTDIPDKYVVDTMIYYRLEETELENGNICVDSDYICG